MQQRKPTYYKDNEYNILFQSKGEKKKFVSCERKAKLSLVVANKIIRKEAKNNKLFLKVYSCPRCGYWHLTKQQNFKS